MAPNVEKNGALVLSVWPIVLLLLLFRLSLSLSQHTSSGSIAAL